MSGNKKHKYIDYPSTDDPKRINQDKERFKKAKKMGFIFSDDKKEIIKQRQLPEEEFDELIDKHFDDTIHRMCRSYSIGLIGFNYGGWYIDEIEKDLRNLIKETHRLEYEKVRDIKYKYDVNELFQKISPEYYKYISNIALTFRPFFS